MFDLTSLQIFYFFTAAALIGFTKTSVGGVGILAVLLAALAFPGKASPGIILPLLIAADIVAVFYYRRDCQWQVLFWLFPAAIVGIVIGFLVADLAPAEFFHKLIGIVILVGLAISLAVEHFKVKPNSGWLVTSIVGAIAGAASMVANAAGPVFGIFLLQMGLTKERFVGTRSWYFLILNIIKVPFFLQLGTINAQTLLLDLYALPIILLGAWIGVKVLKMINLSLFKWLIRAAVIIAAIRLLVF
ncbi:MAG TPA: sulfite exporter TauE/SafE family protein [Devosia sp.]|nr:sulfite exporter TauE/SafE family protein [Devosia sp.]